MKAAVFHAPGEPLQIEDLPDPDPGAGEVVIEVARCGICGSDLHYTEANAFTYPSGFTPGHETSGVVVAVGKGVERLKPGDHVVPHPTRGCGHCIECLAGTPYWCTQVSFNMGGFAEFKLSPEIACARLPKTLSLDDAALIEPLAVGLLGVEGARLRSGDRIAVLGAGPIGLSSIFWANRLGARTIVASARSTRNRELALTMGSTAFLTTGPDFVSELTALLDGPPDVVIECTGAPGMIDTAVELVRPRGVVSVLGLCMAPDSLNSATALLKEVTLSFSVGTSLRQFVAAADAMDRGSVEPRAMVTDTIDLMQLPETLEALRGGSCQCKVLVKP